MGTNAFQKTGNTVVFLAASTAPTPVQAVSTTLGGNQYRIINNGLVTVFLGYGANASAATSSATVVTTSGPAIPLYCRVLMKSLRLCLMPTSRVSR
jgi:hypothetical protein